MTGDVSRMRLGRSQPNCARAVVCAALGASLALASPGWADNGGGEGGNDNNAHITATGDHDELEIAGEIPATCAFTQLPTETSLGAAAANLQRDVGLLGFTCNLAVLSTINITVKSAYGALKRTGGSETITYQARWAAAPALASFTAASAWFPGPFAFTALTAANGVAQSGQLTIKLTGTPSFAGNYSDTLTFTVAP
jgi:hypothetical protein